MEVKYLQFLSVLLISINITQPIPSAAKDSIIETPIIPQFPSLNARQLCYGLFFEALPIPTNEKYFIGCIMSEGIILQCNGDNVFDPNIRKCTEKAVETTTQQIPTTTQVPTTTTQVPTTTPDYNHLCEGINNEFVNHPTDCGMAIFCHNEMPFVTECPEGTIFDIKISQCRSGNRDTCEFYETTTLSPDFSRFCNGLDRVFVEHPTNCQKAIFCLDSTPIVSTCRENTIFDISINNCRYGNPETCEFYTPTTTAPNFDELCEGLEDQFVSHPTDCAIAIFCHNNQAFLSECNGDTIFDYISLQCRPGNRDTCEFYEADMMIQPTQNEEKSLRDLCKGHHFNYIKHPHDCDKAIFCYDGESILKECPMNNVFDINTESCVEGSRETCEFKFEEKAPCTEDFLPHETDKSKYYRCKSGVTYSMICERNQVFDINKSACVDL